MSEDPTKSKIRSWNNDGMWPDWKPVDLEKNFWSVPEYRVPVIEKIEIMNRQEHYSNEYPNKKRIKVYKKMQNEISSILNHYDPLKAYLEGINNLIKTNDIYKGRVNIVGFKYRSIIVECYVCLEGIE